MTQEMQLTPDAGRALQEAQNLCWRANVAIVAADHLLAGCLLVLAQAGLAGLPSLDTIRDAILTAQGSGSTGLDSQVMFGSSARDAINATARAVREAGGASIDARRLAAGTIESGEVNPMFYSALGCAKADLLAALAPPA